MQKLDFLVGRWSGTARIWRGPGDPAELIQTEEATFRLDGLILVIEGVGRDNSSRKVALQALGIVSYDDIAGAYHMRAFNDGRWLETEVKLDDHGQGLLWGFVFGEIKTHSKLGMDEEGLWTEVHEISIGSQPARRFMEVAVRRQE